MDQHDGSDVSQECPERPFVFRLPFTVDQQDSAIKQRAAHIQRDLEYIRQHGYEEFEALQLQCYSNDNDLQSFDEHENLGDKFEGSLRNYQVHLLEKCKRSNVIVHLATGMGKTMISIMLIRDYLSKRQAASDTAPASTIETTLASGQEGLVSRVYSKRQILFLVPSIALCVQHSDTLRANLNCTVATACHTSSHTARSRDEISRSDVIVATHGTAKDLLQHYPDVLALSNLDLMVIDEAHYAGTKDHNYATIMKLFYHTLPVGLRPHVLGLTASPLINAKVSDTAERLQVKLGELERTLDSKLHGFPEELADCRKDTKESIVYFDSLLDSFSTKLPEPDMTFLHKSRRKELRQLQALCDDVGLQVTSTYIIALLREIGRNEYDHETIEQFNDLKVYLSQVVVHLNRQVDEGDCGDFSGHTEKMSTLVGLLVDLLKHDDPVGVVFVERRITAIALSHYFNQNKPLDHLGVDIRSDSLVRNASKIFKYLSNSSSHDQQVVDQDFLHQTKRIRSVINKLRTRETNVLIATSVVEEGVDVEACSFIISFDRMKTIKSYIQMKGRARQKQASFYTLVDKCESQILDLPDAQKTEKRIHDFVASSQTAINLSQPTRYPANAYLDSYSTEEEAAMHRGKYSTRISFADLQSAKSLLNRYSMSVPIDPSSRSSKEAMTLHMPCYQERENSLSLPSHLPPEFRIVSLPRELRGQNAKRKMNLLALASIVRLHKLGLLNDRLLPLSMEDMMSWLLKKTLGTIHRVTRTSSSVTYSYPLTAHLYILNQSGSGFEAERQDLLSRGARLNQFALVSLAELPEIKAQSSRHRDMGVIDFTIIRRGEVSISAQQWNEITSFYCTLFNSRWRRQKKKKKRSFQYDPRLDRCGSASPIPPYAVCLVDTLDQIDYTSMKCAVCQHAVSKGEMGSQSFPRMWSPNYNPSVSYIVYGPSGNLCRDGFPNTEYTSFLHYFSEKYGVTTLCPTSKLFVAKRVWDMPHSHSVLGPGAAEEDVAHAANLELPAEVCQESPMADPSIVLQSTLLPQFLYLVERRLTAEAFIRHCQENYEVLGECLSRAGPDSVMEVLTTKTCRMPQNYERLEWLGDAVLKLVQTDSLLQYSDTSYLHEGYLHMLRSVMGSNERLERVAEECGFNHFILSCPLNREEWRPSRLQLRKHDDSSTKALPPTPSGKVCADVVEAILGLIFVQFGFAKSVEVSLEIGLTFVNADKLSRRDFWSALEDDGELLAFATNFTGQPISDPRLLHEAVTHPSCVSKPCRSYQTLEWAGDAAVCLAARNWLFHKKEKLSVPTLVVLESTLTSNQSLAYIGHLNGVQRIIDHRMSELPGRFESYKFQLTRGLWATDPPKVIPDVVESLIGAVHVDQGVEAGQEAAAYVLRPLLDSVSKLLNNDLQDWVGVIHPKQHLYELAADFVNIKVIKEDKCNSMYLKDAVNLCGRKDGNGYVAIVGCKSMIIGAAIESSKTGAVNVACALVVEMLKAKPSLVSQLRGMMLS